MPLIAEKTTLPFKLAGEISDRLDSRKADGTAKTFQAHVMLLTPKEVEYFKHGGLLQYVLRQLAAA